MAKGKNLVPFIPPTEEEIMQEINPTILKQGGTVNKLDYINKLNGESMKVVNSVSVYNDNNYKYFHSLNLF